MRVLIYGTLALLAALVLVDVNLGHPVTDKQSEMILASIRHVQASHLPRDYRVLLSISKSDNYRQSRLLALFLAEADPESGFYAYTPVLSRSRIFVGAPFWELGEVGQSSILVHEGAHITAHRRQFTRGFRRFSDEEQAYLHQYRTYRELKLTPTGDDSIVFWDMMIGIQKYVLPKHPDLTRRQDIRYALSMMVER